ncbi:MAG: helix-turn-helix transcriptional regulator, partial [Kiritimatiellae bacterium]|nr:helix-turn-helix transcriptional regulator [Kiritimatiellia bacterium]
FVAESPAHRRKLQGFCDYAAKAGWIVETVVNIGALGQSITSPDELNIYDGFVADHSPNLNCVTIRPVTTADGRLIGTATIYWRAEQKMKTAFWYEPIRKAVVYLDEHFAENVTVAQLAEIAHYSEAQFRRLFHALMQTTPSDYIASVRVNAAKTLLANTDKRISDIAAETGFFDHAHMIRTFRRLTGLTPAKYRRRLLTPARCGD